MALDVLQGGSLTEDDIVAEAYKHVADGYRRALAVPSLPRRDRELLRHCLRAAAEIAGERCAHIVGGDA